MSTRKDYSEALETALKGCRPDDLVATVRVCQALVASGHPSLVWMGASSIVTNLAKEARFHARVSAALAAKK